MDAVGVVLLLLGMALAYFLMLPFLRRRAGGARGPREGIDDSRILFRCAVHGESHYQANIRRAAAVGKAVALVPEPSNPYDKNAMRVDVDGLTVGYIPRDQAADAADDEWKAVIAGVYTSDAPTGIVLGVIETRGRKRSG